MMKKKIAIQTQTPYNNYGGILQAFALQQLLIAEGNEVIILSTRRNKDNNFKGFLGFLKKIIQKINYSEYFKKKKKMDDLMKESIDKYLIMSPFLSNYNEWCRYIESEKFDILIAGSDQIWRLDYNREQLRESYLDYDKAPIKKVSYAASLGVSEINNELEYLMKKYLPSFDAISVREQDSIGLLKEIGFDATLSLDPTLLLNADDYINTLGLKKIDLNSVFVYSLSIFIGDNEIKQNLNTDLKIKRISGDLTIYNYKDPNFYKPSFVEWLQSIYSSEIVITDSFHGMVFAIIFKKPFYVIVNYGRGASRFTSLLSQLGLMDRIWDGKSNIETKPIDYSLIYEKLKKLKEKSMEYLHLNLN